MADQDVYAVVLAGGSGTRFWPKSRLKRPKQLCRIGSGEKTMLEITLDRLDGFVPPERRMIVTHTEQVGATEALVGRRCAHFVAEPEARNTANALALAALRVKALHKGPGAPVMISLHADHVIENVPAFLKALDDATKVARTGKLTLVGITPKYAETGYGYIERGPALPAPLTGAAVASFREKPDRTTAETFLKRGNFLWNAGMFVWRIDVFLEELTRTLPVAVETLAKVLNGGSTSLAEAYKGLPKISIDNALLEVSRNVAVVEADIGWQDVGSWDALARCFNPDAQGNLGYGDVLMLDTRDTTVDTDGPFVAALGLSGMVVVVSDGAVLVCPRDKAQDVKNVVEWLKTNRAGKLT